MSWELAYAVFGAPLLILLYGLSMVGIHALLERRERRLYDEHGWHRVAETPPRR